MNGPSIKGWCPGALRPMESGDGLIVRLKLTGGIASTALVRKIAEWSSAFGSGQIDLTSRGNLQLRGIAHATLARLHGAMADEGILDEHDSGEAIRNVIASPLSGIDPSALADIRPLTQALEKILVASPDLHDLPGKFTFAIDDGGAHGLSGVIASDILIEALGDLAIGIWLDGAPDIRLDASSPTAAPAVAAAVARAFLARSRRDPGIRRMRDLVAKVGAEAIAQDVELPFAIAHHRQNPASPKTFLGAQFLPTPGASGLRPTGCASFVGAAPPFGRLSAAVLLSTTRIAEECGAEEIRLSPWRALLIPTPSAICADALLRRLAEGPLIVSPTDSRLRVAACVGAPGCKSATTRVRGDAEQISSLLVGDGYEGVVLHVSGCGKGCAHPRAARITLVGREGRYDLIRNGGPRETAAYSGLAVEDVIAILRTELDDDPNPAVRSRRSVN